MEMPLNGLHNYEKSVEKLKHLTNIRAIHIPYRVGTAIKGPWNDVTSGVTTFGGSPWIHSFYCLRVFSEIVISIQCLVWNAR